MKRITQFLKLLFACRHREISRVYLDETTGINYVVCMRCMRRFGYDWRAMRVVTEIEFRCAGWSKQ